MHAGRVCREIPVAVSGDTVPVCVLPALDPRFKRSYADGSVAAIMHSVPTDGGNWLGG